MIIFVGCEICFIISCYYLPYFLNFVFVFFNFLSDYESNIIRVV